MGKKTPKIKIPIKGAEVEDVAIDIAKTSRIGGQGKGSECKNSKDDGSSHSRFWGIKE